jgi:hypothetical protein
LIFSFLTFFAQKVTKTLFFLKALLPTLQASSPHAAVFCFSAKAAAGHCY